MRGRDRKERGRNRKLQIIAKLRVACSSVFVLPREKRKSATCRHEACSICVASFTNKPVTMEVTAAVC